MFHVVRVLLVTNAGTEFWNRIIRSSCDVGYSEANHPVVALDPTTLSPGYANT